MTTTSDAQAARGRTLALTAAIGVAAGLAANLLRKAAVQAPTVFAGPWDEALAA
ncbi:hypothetical protein [Sphingomonas citri]|nr:hypothetical protein [Sphingomonas citri]